MTTKTKSRTLPLLTLAAVVLAGAYLIPWETLAGTTSNGHRKVVEVFVSFAPSPRPMHASVYLELTVGPEHLTDRLTESPFQASFSTKIGEVVTASALQHTDGTLSCRIKVDRKEVTHNTTNGLMPLICTTVVA